MEINRTTDYAIRVVMDLALQGRDRRVTSADIARRQEIPRDYISKVLVTLSRARIVATLPGRGGGVQLLRPPASLSVLEVLEAVEGPLTLNRCLARKGECPRDRSCAVHDFWARTQKGLAQMLQAATIAGLLSRTRGHGKNTTQASGKTAARRR
jgi:Rrf2 family protein